jgi:hypothetical protein
VNVRANRILAQLSILIITVAISWFGHKGFSFRREAEAATEADLEKKPVEREGDR